MQTNTIKEGKAKKFHWDGVSDSCELEFKNTLTALNGQKTEELEGKGVLAANISAKLFEFLNEQNLKTHFIKKSSDNTLVVQPLTMIPLEIVVRNYAAGSLCTRLGFKEGEKLKKPLIQFHLKDDALNDPLLAESEMLYLEIVSLEQLNQIKNYALCVNWLLTTLFEQVKIGLADFKLEFGFDKAGNLLLGDELSPDNMRLWDNFDSNQKLDKDRFRQNLGHILENYQIVLERIYLALAKKDIQAPAVPLKIKLYIKPQAGLLDPTGRTLTDSSNRLGFTEVEAIKAGKMLELELNDYRLNLIEDLCERILVSPAIEEYSYEIVV